MFTFCLTLIIILSLIHRITDKCWYGPLSSGANWMERGGGGDPEPPAPPPPSPSPQETTQQAIDAQISSLPKILQAQEQYGGQFSQQQLDQLNKFGPGFAQSALDLEKQFGGQYAQQSLAEQDILDPSRSAGSRAIASFLQQGPEDLTDEEQRQLQQSARGAAASRGLSQSGFSAQDEISRIYGARQNLKSRYLDVALSASGRLPSASGGVQANPAAYGNQLVQNVNPSQIFGAQANNNSYNASIFGSQGNIYSNQLQNSSSPLGSILGAVGGGLLGSVTGGFGSVLGTSLGKGLGKPGLLGT